MCGIWGVLAPPGKAPVIDLVTAGRLVDIMARRGPDGRGLFAKQNVLFGHRRLAVVDVAGGAQPWVSADGRHALVYNGELYNDPDVRSALEAEGVRFVSSCDTETVLEALIRWGSDALRRLRGMYALAFYDFRERRLLLARDPLGLKPLYVATVRDETIFSSHLPALLAYPGFTPRPNHSVLSAFLSTLRTTRGRDTMFEGISALRPGEIMEFSVRDERHVSTVSTSFREPEVDESLSWDDAVERTRSVVESAIVAHLRADVPRCTLLSGGLDSAIITAIARESGHSDLLRTWCAGATGPTGAEDHPESDPVHATMVAAALGTTHHTVRVGAEGFDARWRALTAESGLPISTPNETAIFAVAEDLAASATVALSGEGADELFGGYTWPLLLARDGVRAGVGVVEHYLRTTAWVTPAQKSQVFTTSAWGQGASVDGLADALAAEVAELNTDDPLETTLRLHRRINLAGLLGRLDTATMAASVEGRTPFADVRVAEVSLAIPLRYKLRLPQGTEGLAAGDAIAAGAVGKAVLRAAFADRLPAATAARPKVSFPLPFQGWLAPALSALDTEVARATFSDEVRALITSDPRAHWQLAWPVLSAARWLNQHWS
jgi:asparagine synthase (glutamine-hydrolysing)